MQSLFESVELYFQVHIITLRVKITDVVQVYRHLGSYRNWDYLWTEIDVDRLGYGN